ncbi:MAG TPA: DUF2232 domain-containing protein [Candidatus Hydrogenedentes bacterium]|nr:DUF2232 domain-containing protein [Candidatus Hydrogenedentota bacterium]HPG67808.1 DUF2232 domain-containing protein [Candidatus Hydrogenedentota bacterium]
MASYAKIFCGLFAAGVAAAWLGLGVVGMAIFTVPVAVFWAREERARAVGLVICASLAGATGLGSWRAMAYFAPVAALGVVPAFGALHGWRYTRAVAVLAAAAYALVIGHVLAFWNVLQAQAPALFESLASQWAQMNASESDARASVVLEQIEWLAQHWSEVLVGALWWPVLMAACVAVSWTERLRRCENRPEGIRGTFRAMRPSEWLVWGVILVAALWFVDRAWPNAALRLVTRNAAVALAAVYWLNGVSMVVYLFSAFQPRALTSIAAIALLVMLGGAHPLLCGVGLFDTWADFRKTIDRVVAARQRVRQSPDNDDEDT